MPHYIEPEPQKISFKRFLPSTIIDLTTLANAKDALACVMDAAEDFTDKIALAGSTCTIDIRDNCPDAILSIRSLRG